MLLHLKAKQYLGVKKYRIVVTVAQVQSSLGLFPLRHSLVSPSISTSTPSQEETLFSFLFPFSLNFHVVSRDCSHYRIQLIFCHECS